MKNRVFTFVLLLMAIPLVAQQDAFDKFKQKQEEQYSQFKSDLQAEFEQWKCLKDEDGILCLTAEVESPWSPPITFFEYMNALDEITVYAYGREYFYYGYKYNGRTGESVDVEVKESDSRYQALLQEYAAKKGVDLNSEEAKKGCIPGFYPEEVAGRLLEEHLNQYKAEIYSELSGNI